MIAVPLTRGFEAVVDDCDAALAEQYRWQVKAGRGTRYAVHVRSGKSISLHRLILAAEPGEVVDHVDGNGLNNVRSNLRICTIRNNAENRAAYVAQKRSVGGYLGIYRQGHLWVAGIHAGELRADGQRKRISLKCHATPEDAARAYDSAAAHYFGAFAALNFPDEPPKPFDLASLQGSSPLSDADRIAISRDSMRKNARVGAAHGMAKLGEEDVMAIRSSVESSTVLAARFGVHVKTIGAILAGNTWRDLTGGQPCLLPPRGSITVDKSSGRFRLRNGTGKRESIGTFATREEAELARAALPCNALDRRQRCKMPLKGEDARIKTYDRVLRRL